MSGTRIAVTAAALALGLGLVTQAAPRPASRAATRPVADTATAPAAAYAGSEAAAHGAPGTPGTPGVPAWTAPPFVVPFVAPEPATRGTPWFRTPQAAMRYLATAYSGRDDRALAQVTTPDARSALLAMRGYAPALWLKGCKRLAAGDYDCTFGHSVAKTGKRDGYALFRVAPAIRHGWYMTVLMDCGDGPEG
jgi:hypothetical protein